MTELERRIQKLESEPMTGKPCGKNYYTTYSIAREARRKSMSERNVKLRIYKCPVCLMYHLTSHRRGHKVITK